MAPKDVSGTSDCLSLHSDFGRQGDVGPLSSLKRIQQTDQDCKAATEFVRNTGHVREHTGQLVE